jgi:hypothetical protein
MQTSLVIGNGGIHRRIDGGIHRRIHMWRIDGRVHVRRIDRRIYMWRRSWRSGRRVHMWRGSGRSGRRIHVWRGGWNYDGRIHVRRGLRSVGWARWSQGGSATERTDPEEECQSDDKFHDRKSNFLAPLSLFNEFFKVKSLGRTRRLGPVQ